MANQRRLDHGLRILRVVWRLRVPWEMLLLNKASNDVTRRRGRKSIGNSGLIRCASNESSVRSLELYGQTHRDTDRFYDPSWKILIFLLTRVKNEICFKDLLRRIFYQHLGVGYLRICDKQTGNLSNPKCPEGWKITTSCYSSTCGELNFCWSFTVEISRPYGWRENSLPHAQDEKRKGKILNKFRGC